MTKSGQFEVDLVSKELKWHDYPSDTIESLGIRVRHNYIVSVDNRINLKTVWQHLLSLLRFGTLLKGSHWNVAALPVVKRLVDSNRYDYVLTKNESSFLLGYWLKRRNGLKWVATWNDPYPKILYPEEYLKYWNVKPSVSDRRVMNIMARYADIHIFPNSRLRDHMLKSLEIPLAKTSVIPHVVVEHELNRRVTGKVMRIIHSGNINYPRDPELFLKAFRLFLNKHQDAAVEVTVMGVTGADLQTKIESNGLEGHVFTIPPVSYNESISRLADFDVAMIIEAKCKEGIFLPTKVSDFMQEGIPVFTISPAEGVLHDLHRDGYIPYYASNESVESIFAELERLYSDFCGGNIAHNVIPGSYTEKSVTETYLSF